MTGTKETGGRRGAISVSSESPQIVGFGPQTFTRAEQSLYDVNGISPAQAARARARSLWGDVADDAIKWVSEKGSELVRTLSTGYTYARAREDGYVGAPYSFGDIEIDPERVGYFEEVVTGGYPVEQANQPFLKKITGITKRFVYGAYWNGKLFVDRYLKGLSDEQHYATLFHEAIHKLLDQEGVEDNDEGAVEATGKAYAFYLKEHGSNDYIRGIADKAWRGFVQTEYGRKYEPLGELRPALVTV